MFKKGLLFILLLSASACTTIHTTVIVSELEQGKRKFESGYYKSAMKTLFPLAVDGNAEAQYAVGYMYYYGYGVAQDTDMGIFWIERSAKAHYMPAIKALASTLKQ